MKARVRSCMHILSQVLRIMQPVIFKKLNLATERRGKHVFVMLLSNIKVPVQLTAILFSYTLGPE
uniref:Uncharacterized protein n=1 Tax=Arundo donax TaxID=35708 RepID=A0A0A9GW33_ARUDO